MSSNTSLSSGCPAPFLEESAYPLHGGYINGRLCAPLATADFSGGCCLPCPVADWIYPDEFYPRTRIAGFVALASLILCAFMLFSFAVLPAEKTRRQYLNVCLVISVFIFELGFTVPVLARPNRCYNAITPNSATSNLTCAFSGAFVILGGAATNMWTFVRALSMHLMVCWDVTPKSRYYYSVQILAWSISGLLLGVCLGITGTSFRFGDYCLVNHEQALQTLWGPILGITAITTALQLSTFGYCLHVYLRSLRAERIQENSSRTSVSGMQRHQTARAVYQRVKKVVQLQGRALAIVTIMIVYIIFFCLVFVVVDAQSVNAIKNTSVTFPWVACLIKNGGNKEVCLSLAEPLEVNERLLLASLVLFSVLGIQAAVLVGRVGMVTGWIELFKAWWEWRSGKGDIGFGGSEGTGGAGDEAAMKELEEQRMSISQPICLDDKRTYELVRISDASGKGTRLATIETGKRASAFDGTVSSTISSGPYGSEDIAVAVMDEDDDFASEYLKEYAGATFGSPIPRAHRHKKSSSSGGWVRANEPKSHSVESLTALPPVDPWDERRRDGGKNWPL